MACGGSAPGSEINAAQKHVEQALLALANGGEHRWLSFAAAGAGDVFTILRRSHITRTNASDPLHLSSLVTWVRRMCAEFLGVIVSAACRIF
jgi:hypothetical protein